MAIKELSDYGPDGNRLGQAAADKVSFFGATPVVQRSGAGQAAVATTGVATGAVYGFTTAAQGNAVVTLLNQIRGDLVTLGIIKGSA